VGPKYAVGCVGGGSVIDPRFYNSAVADIAPTALAMRRSKPTQLPFDFAGDREGISPRRRNGLMNFVVRGHGNDPVVGIFSKPSCDFRN
jgi:hypothetical protein